MRKYLGKLFAEWSLPIANLWNDRWTTRQRQWSQLEHRLEKLQISVGCLERQIHQHLEAGNLCDHEYQVFSQWGEDGILDYLVRAANIQNKTFVEFGVEDFTEANTRWLLMTQGWQGLVIDGSAENIEQIKKSPISWKYPLTAVSSFITAENINELLSKYSPSRLLGILSIDVDGVDYWIWRAIHTVTADIVVVEYNSLFGPDEAVTVPYDPGFLRSQAHFSQSYYGASIAALIQLGEEKGYACVGSNSAGNNAFFLRKDLLPSSLRALTASQAYVRRGFREARDPDGKLGLPSFEEERELIKNLPLVRVGK